MSLITLKCFKCKKEFSIEFLGKVMVYDKNIPYPVPVHLFTNVEQVPAIKYFCKKSCKDSYLALIRYKNWNKYKYRQKETYLIK